MVAVTAVASSVDAAFVVNVDIFVCLFVCLFYSSSSCWLLLKRKQKEKQLSVLS